MVEDRSSCDVRPFCKLIDVEPRAAALNYEMMCRGQNCPTMALLESGSPVGSG